MNNILKHLFRLWKRQNRFFIVNVLGLSIGLAVSILLILYIFNEVSYDRYFEKKDRIVRLLSIWKEDNYQECMPICTRKAFTELPSQVSGIDNALQIYRGWEAEIVTGENRFPNVNMMFADTSFFSFFEFSAIYGNPAETLKKPYSVVFTQSQAVKIFGKGNPVGKTFSIDTSLYSVGAVIQDIPENTHFRFDLLTSMASFKDLQHWGGLEFFTYYLVNPKSDKNVVTASIVKNYTTILNATFGDEFNSTFDAETENLTDIHLFSNAGYDLTPKGSIKTVVFLVTLALLILLLAIANFVNLFLVQGESRSSEIGIRKVNGAGNKAIIFQFFGESSSLVILSFITGFLLIGLLIPLFTTLIGHSIETSLLYSPLFILSIFILIVVVVVLASFYPAIYLGRLNPVKTLGKGSNYKFRKQNVITAVVTFQSVITIFLISLLLIMTRQINHLKTLPLGYDPENVMVIFNSSDIIKNQYTALQDKLYSIPEVEKVSAGNQTIGLGYSGQGIRLAGASSDKRISINEYRILPGGCETFGLQLKEGRFFYKNNEGDRNGVVLNEAAVKKLGLTNAIGEKVVMFEDPMEIIGVVKDFYYESTAQEVQPLVITNYRTDFRSVFIKFKEGTDKKLAMAHTSKAFSSIDKYYVLNARWSSDMNNEKYYREEMLSKTITWSTVLSIIIAMLGLYTIHSYQILQRTKEIGIRKALGSRISDIVYLTTLKSLKWIAVASIIGAPVAWYAANMWLQNYANRIPLGIVLFSIPVIIQVLLAFLITSAESMRTARQNPVKSLRYE